MKIRNRSHYRLMPIWLLVLVAFAGMILTTLAQADSPERHSPTPYLEVSTHSLKLGPLFSVESASSLAADEGVTEGKARSWLLADGLKGVYSEGVFHVHISGLRAGNGETMAAHSFGRMELILSAGNLDTEAESHLDAGEGDDLLMNMVGDYRLLQGDVFAISVGKRW